MVKETYSWKELNSVMGDVYMNMRKCKKILQTLPRDKSDSVSKLYLVVYNFKNSFHKTGFNSDNVAIAEPE